MTLLVWDTDTLCQSVHNNNLLLLKQSYIEWIAKYGEKLESNIYSYQ
jgi:hypothetical protein